jgi:ribose 5-phosphate isomerase B
LAAQAVASGECDRGIIICGTGVGISIAANKVKGIRCVACSDCYSAQMSRRHNNANMLALGARVVGADLAKLIVKLWLEAEFEGGRHQRRVDMITKIEAENIDFL